MNKFLTWFTVSSADPNAFSMTLKGLLLANVGVIMYILHLLNIPYSIEQVTNIIGALTGVLGSVMFLSGAIRKLVLTFVK